MKITVLLLFITATTKLLRNWVISKTTKDEVNDIEITIMYWWKVGIHKIPYWVLTLKCFLWKYFIWNGKHILKSSNSSKKKNEIRRKYFLKAKVDLQMKSCFAQQFSLMVVVRQQGDRHNTTLTSNHLACGLQTSTSLKVLQLRMLLPISWNNTKFWY